MTKLPRHRLFIGGEWIESSLPRRLTSPYSGDAAAEVDQADGKLMEKCLASADAAFHAFRGSSRFARASVLKKIAAGIEARREDLRNLIIQEAGKPYGAADGEISRAINTFTLAAEEVRRFAGELVPVDLDAGSRGYRPAVTRWFPRGPVLAIAPFNFPLNLIAHKVAPALAVGAPVIVKPPPQAPGPASILAEIFTSARTDEVPLGALQVINAPNEVLAPALTDPRIAIVSFTGSDTVGWMLKEKASKKRVLLELGGNAAAIVHSDADLERAASRLALGAFSYAGQVCISVQRIMIHKSVVEKFNALFAREVEKLKVGNPADKDTVVGPLIDTKAADRVEQWINEARKAGAKIVRGGRREKNVIWPTVLTDVPPGEKLVTEEAFGPVVVLSSYEKFDDALAAVNRSRFGLQAGIFTDSAALIDKAFNELDVGGVIVGDGPTYRQDNMPYGGVKDSGDGREGLRYAMEEYCDRRVLVQFNGASAI